MFWRREWLRLFCFYQEKAKQQGTRTVSENWIFLEGGWEVTEVWSECGRNVSWWLIAWFKFHGARHPPWRPSFYTASLIPGECHCHSEAASVTRGPSQAKQHFLEAGDSFIEPSPQSPPLSSLITRAVRPVGPQGINISGCLPTSGEIRWPLWKATPEASACHCDARNRACDVLTSLSGHPCSWLEWGNWCHSPMWYLWSSQGHPMPDVLPSPLSV